MTSMIPYAVPVSREERRLILVWFERGRRGLLDTLNDDEADEFLARPEIKLELEALSKEFDDRMIATERVRNRARSDLGKLAPAAVHVLQKSLAGSYPDPSNKEQMILAPSSQQFKAAKAVLDFLGVKEEIEDVGDTEINVNIDNRHAIIEGPIGAQTSRAVDNRNRVRSFVEGVISNVRVMVSEGAIEDAVVVGEKTKRKKKKKRKKKRVRDGEKETMKKRRKKKKKKRRDD